MFVGEPPGPLIQQVSVTMVEKGGTAPDFTLATDEGDTVTLSELRGGKVVVYFYPKDDTPGCTIQACDLRERMPLFRGADVTVLGVSPDGADSHAAFRARYDLNFPLLVDADHAVAELYGVWQEQFWDGRTYMGIERSTFVIDEEGVVVEAWRGVKAEGHADRVAKAVGVAGSPQVP
jgi:peroxiredoxin Q/BCP